MVLIGLATIITGIFLVVSPDAAALTICLAVGWILLVTGAIALYTYYRDKKRDFQAGSDLVIGVIEVALGIVMIVNPGIFAGLIGAVVAIVMFIHGVNDVTEGLAIRKMGSSSGTPSVVMGVLTIVFGIVILINPFASLSALMMLIGVGLIFDGVTELMVAYRTARFMHDVKDDMDM